MNGRSRSPEAQRAHGIVHRAVRDGLLVRPKRCPSCRGVRAQVHAHHADYSQPLKVLWLCTTCHALLHRPEQKDLPRCLKCGHQIFLSLIGTPDVGVVSEGMYHKECRQEPAEFTPPAPRERFVPFDPEATVVADDAVGASAP